MNTSRYYDAYGRQLGDHDPRYTAKFVNADDHDALAARLSEVERLLQEVYDGRQSLMSVGLVYRIGHTLNHR